MMRVAFLTSDSREVAGLYSQGTPSFGTAPEALLAGMVGIPELEIHVISCLQKPASAPEKLAPNIFYHPLHVPKIGWLRTGYQGCIRAVRRKLREIKPDIVHGQGTERDCAISAVFSGFPNIVTIHGNMAQLARSLNASVGSFAWFAAQLENFTLRRTDGVLCNSSYTESLVKPRSRRTWKVANPIRQEFFDTPKGVRSHKCILLNVGVISKRKRQIELLKMAEQLFASGRKFELHFIGSADPTDPYACEFLRQVQPAERQGFARYLGSKGTLQLIECFDRATALIHFPIEEAFGLVVAEGLARNLKFFGAATGGIVDIASGVDAVELVDSMNWEALESTIANWINSGAKTPTNICGLMQQRYHPQVIAQQHLKVYQETLATRS